MELNCLYINDAWLRNNGLDSKREIIIKVGLKFIEVSYKSNIPKPPDKKVGALIKKLLKQKISCYDGSILVEGVHQEKKFIFKDNEGVKYLLCPLDTNLGAVGYNIPDVLLLGLSTGGNQDGQSQILPVAIFQKERAKEIPDGPIPIGVPGLAELLFPNLSPSKRGFQKPSENNVVPRLIIVKGAIGTGKTTLATQMMVNMAREGFRCDYWCSNDCPSAIKKTAISFKFCDEPEYNSLRNTKISVLEIGSNYLEYLKLPTLTQNPITSIVARFGLERTVSALLQTDILFLDSLNLSQIKKDVERQNLWEIFCGFRKLPLLSIFLLEDYQDNGTEQVRQLISDCEFLSDVVIDLSDETRSDYHTKSIRIKKKHYGEQVYGTHYYKICPVEGALPDMNTGLSEQPLHNNNGILVFPSIHRYLSRARIQEYEPSLVNTGITHLDTILLGGSIKLSESGRKKPEIDKGSMESNSCLVITGERGGHKLPIGLNILMGGMWKVDWKPNSPSINADKDVLLILLDEEADIHIDLSATAINSHLFTNSTSSFKTLDNGQWIRWMPRDSKSHHREEKCDWCGLFKGDMNKGKKVRFDAWCAEILNEKDEVITCRKLVIAGFRPGCITPEEFIFIVNNLLQSHQSNNLPFSRVLFVSTAHLQNRFPILGGSELFIPALVDLFKSKNVVSIFIDVKGAGSDEKLSYGLTALADYIICVDEFSRDSKYSVSYPAKLDQATKESLTTLLKENSTRYVSSRMRIENVRGKEYSRPCHAITVRPRPGGKGNDLYIINAREEQPVSLIFK